MDTISEITGYYCSRLDAKWAVDSMQNGLKWNYVTLTYIIYPSHEWGEMELHEPVIPSLAITWKVGRGPSHFGDSLWAIFFGNTKGEFVCLKKTNFVHFYDHFKKCIFCMRAALENSKPRFSNLSKFELNQSISPLKW